MYKFLLIGIVLTAWLGALAISFGVVMIFVDDDDLESDVRSLERAVDRVERDLGQSADEIAALFEGNELDFRDLCSLAEELETVEQALFRLGIIGAIRDESIQTYLACP